jgi:hypothetical protein
MKQAPVLEAFLSPRGAQWRLYMSRSTWCPPALRTRLDDDLEAVVERVDVDQLQSLMWEAAAPYEKAVTPLGGVGLRAAGRSAIVLGEWLVGLFERT